jgi:hypothetical protein
MSIYYSGKDHERRIQSIEFFEQRDEHSETQTNAKTRQKLDIFYSSLLTFTDPI